MTKQPGRAYEHVQRKLTEQERTALRESLAIHGLRDSITLDQHGDILDGYNREDLCRDLGVERRYRVLEVDDPVHWIRHNQRGRRNLDAAEMREKIVETKAQNPEASTRQIAEQLGADKATVARVLKNATASGEAVVNRVKGKDGKVRTYTSKPKADRSSADLEKALHAYDRRKAAGESLDRKSIAEEIGTSITPARFAIAQREAEAKLGQQAEIVLSASAQEKFDAKVRALRKDFDLEVETKARAEANKLLDEWHIPEYMKALRTVERLLEWRRGGGGGIMTRAEYRVIQRVLHPDTGAHVSDERRNEAFRLFTQYEAKLVADNEQADIKRVSTLPRTREEMLARKKTKR